MNTRLAGLLAGTVAAVVPVLSVAAPAQAQRAEIDQLGRGTWTETGAQVDFTGETAGRPFNGTTTGSVAPNDGSLPPWGGCEPGSGTLTTTSPDGKSLTLRYAGDICIAVAPSGRVIFKGWYDVVSYSEAKGKKAPAGRGSVELRTFTDGTYDLWLNGSLR